VTIRATAIGSDAAAAIPFSAAIRLVPPGVILPPADTPTAAFTISPMTALANTPVQFNAGTSCGAPLVSGACQSTSQIAVYSWDFGDGSSGGGRTTSHTYTTGNGYNVTLTVTNDRGVSASTTQPVTVGAASMPVAAFAFSPARPETGDAVFFTAAASVAGQGHMIASYQWSYGDGETAVGRTPTHRYAGAATYVVTLTVTDNAGQSASIGQNVTIFGSQGPTAAAR
jgi:PKD repeat protein